MGYHYNKLVNEQLVVVTNISLIPLIRPISRSRRQNHVWAQSVGTSRSTTQSCRAIGLRTCVISCRRRLINSTENACRSGIETMYLDPNGSQIGAKC